MLLNRVGNLVLKEGGGSGGIDMPPDPYIGRLHYKPDGKEYDDVKEVMVTNDIFVAKSLQTSELSINDTSTMDDAGNIYCLNYEGNIIVKLTKNLDLICKVHCGEARSYKLQMDDKGNFYLSPYGEGTAFCKYTPEGELVWEIKGLISYSDIFLLDKKEGILYARYLESPLYQIDLDGTVLNLNYDIENVQATNSRILENGILGIVLYRRGNKILFYNKFGEKLGDLIVSNAQGFVVHNNVLYVAGGDVLSLYSLTGELLHSIEFTMQKNSGHTDIRICFNEQGECYIVASPNLVNKVKIEKLPDGEYTSEVLYDNNKINYSYNQYKYACHNKNNLYVFDRGNALRMCRIPLTNKIIVI